MEKITLENNKVIITRTLEDRQEITLEEINYQLAYWQKLKDLF